MYEGNSTESVCESSDEINLLICRVPTCVRRPYNTRKISNMWLSIIPVSIERICDEIDFDRWKYNCKQILHFSGNKHDILMAIQNIHRLQGSIKFYEKVRNSSGWLRINYSNTTYSHNKMTKRVVFWSFVPQYIMISTPFKLNVYQVDIY